MDECVDEHHPDLHMTMVMKLFRDLGWDIIFTVPYWEKSQPTELAWAYVKGYVARKYHPGRTTVDVRRQILQGVCGSPDGKHTGMTCELATKLILKTHKFINEFVVKQSELNDMGLVGHFLAADAPRPVITTPVNV